MKNRIVFESPDHKYRILEMQDETYQLEDLKGDCYNPLVNPDIDSDKLKQEEQAFESLVENEGVFGYILELWNPEVGCGYETVDSIFGFVGMYSETISSQKHYIVDEMKETILKNTKQGVSK